MTVLNFPASPALNDTYTANNVTYTWNGSYWDANSGGGSGGGGAAAWGNIDGDNTILGGMNVASVTGTTIREVKFSTPMPDGNYSVVATSTNNNVYTGNRILSQEATGFKYSVTNADGNAGPSFPFNFTVNALNALPPKGGTGTDAWATVDQTAVNGPCNVPGSFNVKSVTRTEKGKYDVVFTNPMPNNNYAISGSINGNISNGTPLVFKYGEVTTTGFTVATCYTQLTSGVASQLLADLGFSFAVNATNATLPSTITQEDADLIIDTIKGGGVAQKVVILADVKPTGTTGGTSVAGWQDRTLNTIQSDTGNLVTLANDKEFTLKAGTYLIEWSAPAWKPAIHKTRLTNVTDGTPQAIGSNAYNNPADFVQTSSGGSTRVSITSDTTYKIEHYCEVGAGDGLGTANSTGENEIYTQVTITDLAVLAAGGGGGGTTVNYNGTDAWATVDKTESNGACNVPASFNIASVTRTDLGKYNVVFTTPMPTNDYGVVGTIDGGGGGTPVFLSCFNKSSTGFSVYTYNALLDAAIDRSFSFTVNATNAIAPQSGVGADAWAYIDASGTVGNNFNIKDANKTSTGTYEVEFTTPMPTDEYAVVMTPLSSNCYGGVYQLTKNGFTVIVRSTSSSGNFSDQTFYLAVFASSTVTPTYTWKRDGTTLKPANAGDDIEVDGSITAAGAIKSGPVDVALNDAHGTLISWGGSNTYGRISVQATASAPSRESKYFYSGYLGDTRVFRVNLDGKVTANGGYVTQSDIQSTSQNGAQIGGFRNQIINGDFRVWQRGTSISLPDSTNPGDLGQYTTDRWFGGAALSRVSQASSGVGNFAYEANITPGSDPTAKGSITQSVELAKAGSPSQFVPGSTWTLSFYSNRSTLNASGAFCDGANQFGTSTATSVFSGTPALIAGETQRYSSTFTIPNSLSLGAANTSFAVRIALTTGDQVRVTGVQLEPGPVATPFEHRPVGTELALCQRYYEVGNCSGQIYYANSQADAGDLFSFPICFKATKRVPPRCTAVITSGTRTSPGVNNITAEGASGYSSGLFSSAQGLDYTADAEL